MKFRFWGNNNFVTPQVLASLKKLGKQTPSPFSQHTHTPHTHTQLDSHPFHSFPFMDGYMSPPV